MGFKFKKVKNLRSLQWHKFHVSCLHNTFVILELKDDDRGANTRTVDRICVLALHVTRSLHTK